MSPRKAKDLLGKRKVSKRKPIKTFCDYIPIIIKDLLEKRKVSKRKPNKDILRLIIKYFRKSQSRLPTNFLKKVDKESKI